MADIFDAWREDVRRMTPRGAGGLRAIYHATQTQGIWAVTFFRLGAWLRRWPRLLRMPALVFYVPAHKLVQSLTGIDIPSSVKAGPGLYIGHFGGIILHSDCVLGRDVNLSQQVTIGIGGFGERRGVPRIGSRVYIGPGAKVFGPIEVGDDCIIGANAVVNQSTPPRSIVAGVPAKVIREATADEIQEVIFGRSPAKA